MSQEADALRAWLGLLKASNSLKKSVDTNFRSDFGLSISRFDVLAALDRAPETGFRAGELSQLLMVTEGNTTQVTAPLIRDGLVKRTKADDDGRVAYFRLTSKGRKVFDRMAAQNRRHISNALADLSSEDLTTLRNILGKIRVPIRDSVVRKDAA
ncbi:MAG: MarR family transcriptional regulator [Marinicaulis sp.]|nr:MarR family transcriptional regulator [Marinicaulis sp.]